MENKVELTDTMIRDSFNKTRVDEKYYSVYEAEAKRRYDSFMKDCPDDDDNIESSLSLTDDYIKYYVEEAEKGHCHKWCDSVAIDSINSLTANNKYYIFHNAVNKMDNDNDKEQELEMHVNSLSKDPIFKERYKFLFRELLIEPTEKAREYASIYHEMINEGKSEVYAHAYADVSNDLKPLFCEIYAEAFELAIQHGMDNSDAYNFGKFCTEACGFGYWVYIDDYLKQYNEDWEKEFYLHLICDEIKREEKREISSSLLTDLRKKLGI